MYLTKLHRIKRTFGVSMLLAATFFCQSCNSFLDVDVRHAASENQQWQTFEDTRAALMGVYGLMRSALAENNSYWAYGELRMGDFTVYNSNDLKAVVNNELRNPQTYLEELSDWRRFYAVINAASVFIEKAPQTVELDKAYSEANLKYDIAQVRLLRAFSYFYMVRIWGDVPLLTQSYDNGLFKEIPRTDVQTVLNYAKEEILDAIVDLPFEYGTETSKYYNQVANYWRGLLLNKLSAYTILAHISAWEGNYSNAATYAGYVISHASNMKADYIDVKDLTSPQGLFSMETKFNGYKIVSFNFPYEHFEATQNGHIEQLTLAAPFVQKSYPEIYVSKDSLFSIFDDLTDTRFGINASANDKYYTNYINDLNAEIPLFTKIKVVQDGKGEDSDYAVFGSSIIFSRLEEITLLRAEALAALNRGTEAIADYNTVRSNRGLPLRTFKYFEADCHKLLAAIFDERRKELMGEGWRWFDLIRRERLLNDNPVMRELIEREGIYWPIASEVLSANKSLTQNKYWE